MWTGPSFRRVITIHIYKKQCVYDERVLQEHTMWISPSILKSSPQKMLHDVTSQWGIKWIDGDLDLTKFLAIIIFFDNEVLPIAWQLPCVVCVCVCFQLSVYPSIHLFAPLFIICLVFLSVFSFRSLPFISAPIPKCEMAAARETRRGWRTFLMAGEGRGGGGYLGFLTNQTEVTNYK